MNSELRLYLEVPYAEKDEAKKLGARWDSERKQWYAPASVDQGAFERWKSKEHAPALDNVRSYGFFLMRSVRSCWKCKSPVEIVGILLPPGHYYLDQEDEPAEWKRSDLPSAIAEIATLSEAVQSICQSSGGLYKMGHAGHRYLANHCTKCSALQGDYFLYLEDEGFSPSTVESAQKVSLQYFKLPVIASAAMMVQFTDFLTHMSVHPETANSPAYKSLIKEFGS